MKKIADMISLEGQTETITAMDLRKHSGEILDQASLGKVFTVTRAGKCIAEIRQVEPTAAELGAEIRRLDLAGN